MGKEFYITTPLYYVNAPPHIGHSYTEVAADALARYMRLKGRRVYFMTGTDEHGLKVAQAAQEMGLEPKKFVDNLVPSFVDLWKRLSISNDYFIRTTDEDHCETVGRVLSILHDKKDLYQDKYEGWYCTPCETFWTNVQLNRQTACPECARPLEKIAEQNYFFRISKYQNWLKGYIQGHPDFVKPNFRRNEVLGLLEKPLPDLCISRPRSRLTWGIPVPFSPEHVVYVWFDALLNYISGCGYLWDKKKFKRFWPADIQLIGKDILRPHAIYWPIMLHALGLEPPKTIFAHGWWILSGAKISKSRGKVIDPNEVIDKYGADAYRYFLLREVSFGLDGVYSEEALVSRLNSDLANDLGNLLNRTLVMCEKYFQGSVPPPKGAGKLDDSLKAKARSLAEKIDLRMEELDFAGYLEQVLEVVNAANKYIEESAPWTLWRRKDIDRLCAMIYYLMEVLRIVAIAISPVMPSQAENMWQQMGLKGLDKAGFEDLQRWGAIEAGTKINKGSPLFPRIKK